MAPASSLIPEGLHGAAHPALKRDAREVLGYGPVVSTLRVIYDLGKRKRLTPSACQVAGVHVALLLLCTAAVGLRVWARAWVFRHASVWGWDDTLAVLGLVGTFPVYIYVPYPYTAWLSTSLPA